MNKLVVFFVAVGLVIGLAWPTGRASEPTSVAAAGDERRETVLERESNGHFYVHAKVNGELVRLKIRSAVTPPRASDSSPRSPASRRRSRPRPRSRLRPRAPTRG